MNAFFDERNKREVIMDNGINLVTTARQIMLHRSSDQTSEKHTATQSETLIV